MYETLDKHGYIHKTVLHKQEFVAPGGTHTNNIETVTIFILR